MYMHTNYRNFLCVHICTALTNVKRAYMLAFISQATYVHKKQTPPNMARVSKISNAVTNGPKAQSGGQQAHYPLPPVGLECRVSSHTKYSSYKL